MSRLWSVLALPSGREGWYKEFGRERLHVGVPWHVHSGRAIDFIHIEISQQVAAIAIAEQENDETDSPVVDAVCRHRGVALVVVQRVRSHTSRARRRHAHGPQSSKLVPTISRKLVPELW